MVMWKALDALSHQLELCNIDAGTRVVVLIELDTAPDRVALLRAAIERSGAEAIELRIINVPAPDDDSLLAAALAAADVVLMTAPISRVLPSAALPAELQVLEVLDLDAEAFRPHENLRRRIWALDRQLDAADEIVVSDAHGTNLTIRLGGSRVHFDHGLLDADGARATFPSGWVRVVPAAGTASGTIVIMPGDAIVSARRSVSSPVRLTVVDDCITAIDGDSPDGDVLRALLEYPAEPHAYGIADISVGMNPHPQALTPFDARLIEPHLATLLAGSVTISFGDNPLADRPCSQRVALGLPTRSLTLDGLPVVTNGALQGDFAPDVYEL